MNSKGSMETMGIIVFIGALAVFSIYSLLVYIPAIQADITNADALVNAIWWGVGCGIVGIIGLTMAGR